MGALRVYGPLGMICLCLLAPAGCSKLSDVGSRSEPPAEAVASAIGQPYTTDSSGTLNTTVRAGADVLLSGEDSQKGENDTGSPLISFKWEQLDPGSTPVELIYRTTNTVSFVAPQVTSDTTLKFKLTVADGAGDSASTEADVLVKPVRDADHFLQYLNVPGTFPVVMATQTPIAADPAADATAQLPVTVTMTKLVTFTDRNGVGHNAIPVGNPVTVSTGWTARVGSGGDDCGANENPILRLPIPRINLDDVLGAAAGAFPAGTVLSDAMELADVGSVVLEVRLDADSSAAVPLLCVNGAATSTPSGAIMDAQALLAGATPRDSAASARAYYDTIDTTGSKSTLDGWLAANGFDPAVKGWAADAHAVYTNNYDLGFGRDMYMKLGACDSGAESLPLEQRVGKCDVAAVVVNYAGVEAATKGLNPIVAVAMEYSAAVGGAQRFVKFYTYAYDRRSGKFAQVLSVNLDRRGEEYMPQACTVCHGGTPGTVDATTGLYSNGGDVNAAFLSWDLDSLLYSDTDPGFSHKSRDAALRAQFTRANQEAEFKKLNAGAYLTMADPSGAAGRYALTRELLEGWYGGPGLPSDTFDGSFVPQAWKPDGVDGMAGTADDNPADSATVYSNAFARNCRACHIAQVPVAGIDPRTATVSISGAGALPACTDDPRLAESRVGVSFQVPMGCYWEFAHAPNLADRLSRNFMPFARRTSDRMWVSTDSQSAGELLRAHMLAAQGTTVDVPGTPSACIDSFGAKVQDQGVTKFEVARDAWAALGSSCSRFLGKGQWVLTAPSGSVAALVGADTATPRFLPDAQGDFEVTLSDETGASTASVIAWVRPEAPDAADGTVTIAAGAGGSGSTDVDVVGDLGSHSRDPLANLTIESQNGVTASVSSVTATSATLHITASSAGTVTYTLVDADGDVSNVGTITVDVNTIAAGSFSLTGVTSNGSGTLTFTAANVDSSGQPYTVEILDQPSKDGGRGAGSVSPASGDSTTVFTYTAPLGITSRFGGIQIDSDDQFTYRACFTSDPTVCSPRATVFVPLTGTMDLADVLGRPTDTSGLRHEGCEACHAPSGSPGANSHYDLGRTDKELYCTFTQEDVETTPDTGLATTTDRAGTKFVDKANPGRSLLFLKPQNENLNPTDTNGSIQGTGVLGPPYYHGGDLALSCNPSDSTCLLYKIRKWVDEGAYYTEGSDQSCP